MKRSGGVTAAAIVLFFGSGLCVLFMGLMGLASLLPRPAGVNASEQVPGFAFGMIFYGIFAGWGIATAVGILRLRPWSRISILVMSGFAVLGILFASVAMFLIVPMMQMPEMQPGEKKMTLFVLVTMFAIPLAISIWWFVLFMLKSVRLQFQTEGLPSSVTLAPASLAVPAIPVASPRAIPTSIIVIAIFLLAGAPGMAVGLTYAVRFHLPFVVLGLLVTGWKSTAILVAMGIVQLVLGIGLLRRKFWSLDPTVAYVIFATVNALLFLLSQSREIYFAALVRNYPKTPGLPPDFMMHFMHAFFPFIMIFTVALNLVGLYFLFTRRAAYRAACAATKT
jgi:hypothetical protein